MPRGPGWFAFLADSDAPFYRREAVPSGCWKTQGIIAMTTICTFWNINMMLLFGEDIRVQIIVMVYD